MSETKESAELKDAADVTESIRRCPRLDLDATPPSKDDAKSLRLSGCSCAKALSVELVRARGLGGR